MKKIQVLGTGCQECKGMVKNVEAAAKALGLEYELEKITDITDILTYGVVLPPALAIDGKVKVAGRVPSTEEIKEMLTF